MRCIEMTKERLWQVLSMSRIVALAHPADLQLACSHLELGAYTNL